jgi:hypothetical protein
LKQRPEARGRGERSRGLFSLYSSHYPGSKTSSTTSSFPAPERAASMDGSIFFGCEDDGDVG